MEEEIHGLQQIENAPTHKQPFQLPTREGARQREVKREHHDGVEMDLGQGKSDHVRVSSEISAARFYTMIIDHHQPGHTGVLESPDECLGEPSNGDINDGAEKKPHDHADDQGQWQAPQKSLVWTLLCSHHELLSAGDAR